MGESSDGVGMIGGIKVLLVDDNSGILEQEKIFLEDIDDFSTIAVESSEEALDLLSDQFFDVVVSDYQMPSFDGLDLLEAIRDDLGSDIPFIIFTGRGREEVAIKALNLGADRYIQKGGDPRSQYGVLAKAIRDEVEHYRIEREKNIAIEQWKKTFDGLPDIALLLSPDFEILRINKNGVNKLGLERAEIIGRKCFDVIHGRDSPMDNCPCVDASDSNTGKLSEIHIDESEYFLEDASPISGDSGRAKGFVLNIKDITDYKKMENNLKTYEKAVERSRDLMAAIDTDLKYIFANKAYKEYHGIKEQNLKNKNIKNVLGNNSLSKKILPKIQKALDGNNIEFIMNRKHPELGERKLKIQYFPLKKDKEVKGVVSVIRDFTETKNT